MTSLGCTTVCATCQKVKITCTNTHILQGRHEKRRHVHFDAVSMASVAKNSRRGQMKSGRILRSCWQPSCKRPSPLGPMSGPAVFLFVLVRTVYGSREEGSLCTASSFHRLAFDTAESYKFVTCPHSPSLSHNNGTHIPSNRPSQRSQHHFFRTGTCHLYRIPPSSTSSRRTVALSLSRGFIPSPPAHSQRYSRLSKCVVVFRPLGMRFLTNI